MIAAARQHDDRAAVDRELAGPLDARPLGVADVVQPRDELALADALAGVQRQRPREDARDDAIALAVQPRFDDAGELDVVVAEERERSR